MAEPAPDRQAVRFPVSFPQQRLYFLDALDPGTPAYNVPMTAVTISGPLDVAALERAFADLVARHEVLRTTFADDDAGVHQLIAAHGRIPLDRRDTGADPDPFGRARVFVQQLLDGPMSVHDGPLARALLVTTAPDSAVLAVVMHHLVCDGWSTSVFRGELSTAYAARVAGRAPEFAPLPLQYADFAHWQRQEARSPSVASELRWWTDRLAGFPMQVRLAAARPRDPDAGRGGDRIVRRLRPRAADRIQAFARRQATTPYSVLLTAYVLVLAWFTGHDRLCIGTPVANRGDPQLEGIIGYFANTVVVPVDPAGATGAEVLAAVADQSGLAMAHSDVAFEQLVEALAPPRDQHTNPVFQYLFALHNFPTAPLRLNGATVTELAVTRATARFELALDVTATPDGMRCVWEYDTAVLDRVLVEAVAEAFERVLVAVQRPGSTRAQLRAAAVHARAPVPGPPVVDETELATALRAAARDRPEQTAVVSGPDTATYAELIDRADRWAVWFAAAQRGPVAICLPRGVDAVVAMVASQLAGRTYLPLEPRHPAARRVELLRRSGAAIVVTTADLVGEIVAELDLAVRTPRDLDTDPAPRPAPDPDPQVAAYLMFTSGSTGSPKGVVVGQRGVRNLVAACRQRLRWAEGAVFTCVHSFAFDLSVWEIYAPLLSGGTLVVATEREQGSVAALDTLLRSHRVDVFSTTPTLLAELAAVWARVGPPPPLTVVAGGEALSSATARASVAHGVALWNFYGPTEATVWSTVGPVDPAGLRHPTVPLGTALAGTAVAVLGDDLEPLGPGVAGELAIAGVGLASGYHDAPKLTEAAFVERDGVRWYRTGDVVIDDPVAGLRFLGRRDGQVKVRGYRIELAEVEAALTALPEIAAAAAAAAAGPSVLLADVVAASGHDPLSAPELLARLGGRTPAHLVPDRIRWVDALPRTPNGKIDRAAVTAATGSEPSGGGDRRAPRDATEAAVVAIWREVLDRPDVGPDDDFFALGGHSLLTMRMLDRLNGRFGLDVALSEVFGTPTPAATAFAVRRRIIDGTSAAVDLPAEIPAVPTGPYQRVRQGSDSWLLTGVTGFLGAHVLAELLALGVQRIRCLVRARDAGLARQRVLDTLRRYRLDGLDLAEDQRVEIVVGDLADPDLGLGVAGLRDLGADLDVVVHAGAWVNLAYPYGVLRQVNVGATARLLDVVAASGARFTHISTLSVFGGRGEPEHLVVGSEPAASGYARSKWVADRLVADAVAAGLPAAIVRTGRLFAGAEGTPNEDDLLVRVLRLCREVGSAPELDIEVRLLPVDQAARAVTALAASPSAVGSAYHLVGSQPRHWADLVEALAGVPLTAATTWFEAVRAVSQQGGAPAAAGLLEVLETIEGWVSDPAPGTERADRALAGMPRGDPAAVAAALSALAARTGQVAAEEGAR
ncbi:non-ribosomal peptide synthetase [Pseudonocardia spinosispora]|uniref:non-ribosomal peptide synthetase n=1 Tax=Pseudonocardia spinosispora TaxID=103441 RepID=UPI000413B76B|nr:non-ribosomal peptide synthetase [Pseudonocardia spinosispora]